MAIPSYKTVLDGPDIDDALQQLNDRVAEGWTVGEKNGVPVTSGSPYYENNAKYYAQQAGTFAEAIEGDAEAAQAAAASAQSAAAIAQSIAAGNVLFYDYADNKQYYIAFGASADGYPMITLEEVS